MILQTPRDVQARSNDPQSLRKGNTRISHTNNPSNSLPPRSSRSEIWQQPGHRIRPANKVKEGVLHLNSTLVTSQQHFPLHCVPQRKFQSHQISTHNGSCDTAERADGGSGSWERRVNDHTQYVRRDLRTGLLGQFSREGRRKRKSSAGLKGPRYRDLLSEYPQLSCKCTTVAFHVTVS